MLIPFFVYIHAEYWPCLFAALYMFHPGTYVLGIYNH